MAIASGILAVPGLANTTAEFRAKLWEMANRNNWDVDAIAAVISNESRFQASIQNPLPGQTASGLIQFTEKTAQSLGIPGGATGVRKLSAVEQLPWVEKYYRSTLPKSIVLRPVDYYLAVFMPAYVGKPSAAIIARATDPKNDRGQNVYSLNAGLDVDKDGTLTVSDLARKVINALAAAKGARLDADPPLSPDQPAAEASSCSLPVLQLGSRGQAVALWQRFIRVSADGSFGPVTYSATRAWQAAHGISPSGIVSDESWNWVCLR